MDVPKKQDLLLVSLPENLLRKFPKTAFVGRGGQFLPLVTFSLRLLILLRCQVHLRFSCCLSYRLHPDLWFFTANRRCSPNVRMSQFSVNNRSLFGYRKHPPTCKGTHQEVR